MYYDAFIVNKGNFKFNVQWKRSLKEVFCRVHYTSWTWVHLFKSVEHIFINLYGGSNWVSIFIKAYHYWSWTNFIKAFFSLGKLVSLKDLHFLHYVQSICFFMFASFLSSLACKYCLVYNLLSLSSFQCNTQWPQIHSGKVYWETSTIKFKNLIMELQNHPF